MRLKEQAGWNQRAADWQRFLDLQPDGAFVAELDGAPAGTVATLVFGPVAWVAMVLVDTPLRGRGVGRALMEHALSFLDRAGVRSIRLDATPLGQPLYEKLGFLAEYALTRFEGAAVGATVPPGVVPVRPEHLDGLLRLDRAVTGTDRGRLLLRLFEEFPEDAHVVESADGIAGYLLTRPGARARQLGPCIAQGGAGPLLLAEAWQRYAGQPLVVDVPEENTLAVTLATAAGLTPRRKLVRMVRGVQVAERVTELWASAGPEKG
jgi:GNAT superfamily N-acetyltransferase